MEGGEDVAFVFGGELVAGVKAQIERGRVRLHKHVGNDDFIGKLRVFPFVAWVGMIADVKPRPTIKPAGAHTADVVGRELLADLVPLVCAHPKLVAAGTKRDSYCVSNSPSVNLSICAIRIELKDACAIGFRSVVGIVRA